VTPPRRGLAARLGAALAQRAALAAGCLALTTCFVIRGWIIRSPPHIALVGAIGADAHAKAGDIHGSGRIAAVDAGDHVGAQAAGHHQRLAIPGNRDTDRWCIFLSEFHR
jgi:hypothetical protein